MRYQPQRNTPTNRNDVDTQEYFQSFLRSKQPLKSPKRIQRSPIKSSSKNLIQLSPSKDSFNLNSYRAQEELSRSEFQSSQFNHAGGFRNKKQDRFDKKCQLYEAKQVEECTHSPDLSLTYSFNQDQMLETDVDTTFDRLSNWKLLRDRSLDAKRFERQTKQLVGHTFRPNVSPKRLQRADPCQLRLGAQIPDDTLQTRMAFLAKSGVNKHLERQYLANL